MGPVCSKRKPPAWGDPAPWMRIRPSKERLRPRRKLGEANLAKAFGTTRIHIRQMPAHLASRCIVTQYVNRAAFLIRPAVEGARKVIAARHVVETATVAGAIDRLDASTRDRLQHHMHRERADDRTDRWASLSLRGDFHVLVGKMVVLDFTKELMLRTSLALATFEVLGSPDGSPDAHLHIADLILPRAEAGALQVLGRLLDAIQYRPRLGGAQFRRHRHHLPKPRHRAAWRTRGPRQRYELHTACKFRRHGNESHT